MRFTKWGGKGHWRFPAEVLGNDEFGWWYGTRAGTPLRRGLEEPIIVWHDFVVLMPAAGRWLASWNAPENTEVEVYVDVTDRPVRTLERVEAVDLDLDVVRFRDGSVRLLDEDEFAEHQVLYGYPPEEIAQALATADELMAMVGERREPFDRAGDAWLATFTDAR